MANLKCVFKPVNGNKTGIYCRYGPSKTYTSPGILYMSKCPDGSSFIVENKNYGNDYYKLIDPPKYGLPKTTKTIYVWVDDSVIKSRTVIKEKKTTTKKTEQQPVTKVNTKPPVVKQTGLSTEGINMTTTKSKMTVRGVPTAKKI